jgi:hypothetical protein
MKNTIISHMAAFAVVSHEISDVSVSDFHNDGAEILRHNISLKTLAARILLGSVQPETARIDSHNSEIGTQIV